MVLGGRSFVPAKHVDSHFVFSARKPGAFALRRTVTAVQLDTLFRHGPITPCAAHKTSTFVQEYLRLPEDSLRRQLMERTLGKNNLAKMIRQYQEDEKNREWLENSTTQCPGCSVPCQKSHGASRVRHNESPMLTVAVVHIS
jgi:hypothetical protein